MTILIMTRRERMKHIDSIELIFENCESALIPFDRIYEFDVKNIKKHINFLGSRHENDILDYHYNADSVYISFIDWQTLFYKDSNKQEMLLSKRLSYPDITSVCVNHYKKDKRFTKVLQIYVPWTDNSDINNLQSLKFQDKNSNLHYDLEHDLMILKIGE